MSQLERSRWLAMALIACLMAATATAASSRMLAPLFPHTMQALEAEQRAPTSTVYEFISQNQHLSMFKAAVDAAGSVMVEMMKSRTFQATILIPSNQAFRQMLKEATRAINEHQGTTHARYDFDELLADPDLISTLLYHVLPGSHPAASLSQGMRLTTIQGRSVTIGRYDGQLVFRDEHGRMAGLDGPSLEAGACTVQIITKVLTPRLFTRLQSRPEKA